MARFFLVDASALTKRYLHETGTDLMNHLFRHAAPGILSCSNLAPLEVLSVLVRSKNRGAITATILQTLCQNLGQEVVDDPAFVKYSTTDAVVAQATIWIPKYSINANDALVLQHALVFDQQSRAVQQTTVLVTSDQRLVKAAQAEGLATFNPEIQTQADLDALLIP